MSIDIQNEVERWDLSILHALRIPSHLLEREHSSVRLATESAERFQERFWRARKALE